MLLDAYLSLSIDDQTWGIPLQSALTFEQQ